MICLINNDTIVFGPTSWNLSALLEQLIIAGYDVTGGVLYGPDRTAMGPLPDAEPAVKADLGEFTLLPVVEVDEPAPDGKIPAGREPVIAGDRVELRPIWADAPPLPPAPTLEETQAARKAEATMLRDQRRARGVLFGTSRLAAMPEDQGTYGDSITYLSWKPEGTRIKWKAATGWIEVDLATLRTAAEAVGDFIEALFDVEHAHHIAIDALPSVEAVLAYDITTGWPE